MESSEDEFSKSDGTMCEKENYSFEFENLGNSSNIQICKVIENPEMVREREERYQNWLKKKK